MYKILLTSHGNLCVGMLETIRFFSENANQITAIPFYIGDQVFDEQKALDDYINQIRKEDVVVVLTDICWGSVNQKLYAKVNEMANVHLITGMNLPLVLELITMDEDDINPQSILKKVEDCQGSIVYMNNYRIEFNAEDE